MRLKFLPLALLSIGAAHAQYPPGDWRNLPGYSAPGYPAHDYPPPAGYAPRAEAPQPLSRAMLQAHNAIRSRVGVAPLTWSDNLASVAQDWANRLIATRAFSHRPNNRYGENLYMISGAPASPSDVVGSWASEARGYDFRANACSGVCGHYTQIVWAGTQAVGCAVAGDGRQEVWVCDYDPPGNVVGYRPY